MSLYFFDRIRSLHTISTAVEATTAVAAVAEEGGGVDGCGGSEGQHVNRQQVQPEIN